METIVESQIDLAEVARKHPEVVQMYAEDKVRRARWKPLIKEDEFYGEMRRRGIVQDESYLRHLRITLEKALDELAVDIHRNPKGYLGIANAMMSPRGVTEATNTSAIASFQKFAFEIYRELWPQIAPLAAICSIQNIPLPVAKIFYFKSLYTDAGDYYLAGVRMRDNLDKNYSNYTTEGNTPRQVQFQITSGTMTATNKALLGIISLFASEDYAAYFNGSATGDIAKLIAMQIAREIYATVVEDMRGSATGGTVTWYTTAAASSEYTLDSAGVKRYQETLFDAIEDASALVYAKRFRRLGWVLCDTTTGSRMAKCGHWEFRRTADSPLEMGGEIVKTTEFAGVVNGKWAVYVDPDFPSNRILTGVTPDSWLTSSYVVGMYKALTYVGPKDYPETLQTKIAGYTRFGRYLVDGALIAKVNPTAR
uniref:Putative capsid protein n=1 Tax=viral metagenome TaxID=1070528 RepID=A0A6M3M4B7_9ZZZZ